MQVEPMPTKDGYRCWLSEVEEETLLEQFSEDLEKQLVIELCLDGLRSEEVPRISKEDFRQLDCDEEAYKLRVWESKTGFRECPVSVETKRTAQALANAKGLNNGEPIVNVSERTVQRWVSNAADDLANRPDQSDEWTYVTAHDLRRTWATRTYYSLSGSRAKQVVMNWGGWTDEQTFAENYLGREPDSVAVEMMDEAGLM